MGRPVGGAGAGCAGLGLVGILISVGIVVWLGAQGLDVLSGDDGGGDRPATTTSAPAGGTGPITVALGDGQPLVAGEPADLTALGLGKGEASVLLCGAPIAPDGTVDADACTATIAVEAVSRQGGIATTIVAPSSIDTPGGVVDCTTGACSVVVRGDDGAAGATAIVLAP